MDVCLCGNAYFACYARVNILWVNLCVGWLLFCLLFCLPPRARSLLLSLVVNSYDYALFTNIISFNYRFDSLYNNFYRFFFLSLSQSLSCDRVYWLTARVFLFTRVMFFFFILTDGGSCSQVLFLFCSCNGEGVSKRHIKAGKVGQWGLFAHTLFFV